jgi:hypothetical protein
MERKDVDSGHELIKSCFAVVTSWLCCFEQLVEPSHQQQTPHLL